MTAVERIQRILVYRPGQIGDTLVALPAMWALRNHFQSARLSLLTDHHPKSKFVLAARILPQSGLFDDWMTYPANELGVSWRIVPRLLWEIRRSRFDALVYLAPRHRTERQVNRDLLMFRLAGIKNIIGQHGFGLPDKKQFADGLPMVEHEADHLLRRLKLSGIPVPAPGERTIDLRLTAEEQQQADEWLSEKLGRDFQSKPLIAIGPGSKWPSKTWPESRYRELGEMLIKRFGMFPVIFGGPEDNALATRLIDGWGAGVNAAGALDVRPAAAALTHCRLYIGNDTGTMHLAVAAGLPCVAIFAAIDWPGRWHPYGLSHKVLRRKVTCEGCLLQVCNERQMACLRQIEVEDVMQAVEKMLRQMPQSVLANEYASKLPMKI